MAGPISQYSSWIAGVALSACAAVPIAYADDVDGDRERESLAHLVAEIEQLKPIIDDAQKMSSPARRVQFRYDLLRQDLERVRAGIEEHISAPRMSPRAVEPLAGKYRQ